MNLTGCPECFFPAVIFDRWVMRSTDGPIEHVAIRCLFGHVHRLPSSMLREILDDA